jgi:hypothetical protein
MFFCLRVLAHRFLACECRRAVPVDALWILRETSVREDSRIQRSLGFDENEGPSPWMAVIDSPGLVCQKNRPRSEGQIKTGHMHSGDTRATNVKQALLRLVVSGALPMDKPVDNLGTNSLNW